MECATSFKVMVVRSSEAELPVQAVVPVKINASAVMGKAGLRTKMYCAKLLRKQYVDFIATDAHGSRHRRPLMKECYNRVERKFGKDYSKLLMDTNPRKVLEGERICGKD